MQANQVEQINSEAREWFTLMQSGSVNETERAQCNAWLQADSAHAQAYREYEIIWQELGDLKNTAEFPALQKSITSSWADKLNDAVGNFIAGVKNLSPTSHWAMAIASVAVICVVVVIRPTEKISIAEFATTTGEVKQLTLPDGSQVTLGAKSHMKAWATKAERHVELVSGQAFFKVTKNPARPFLVDAGETNVRVVGTQFDVRRGLDRTRVAVLEGVVKVSTANNPSASTPVVLTAGQQVTRRNDGHFETVNAISVSELESWRNGRLIYLRASLADVVADANRYFNGTISLGSKSLADLKVTAAVSTNQMDSLTDMLSKSLPVELHKDAQNNIVIVARKDSEAAAQ